MQVFVEDFHGMYIFLVRVSKYEREKLLPF